ncbi:MAG: aminoacyl-histidine dipeptidase [bacterium]|jgi:dipeptidase D|nr:aminoacyl-histidine dipeptidase [candidate division KSB1 bacterium]MDH7559153.1 aminoacyl-histidine dipeptidase [bacterium]
MASLLEGLKPTALWRHFDEIRTIPHCSGNEKALGDYVLAVAARHGLAAERDEVGNIVVRKPASPGHEQAETVILQGHLDMVCEKNSDVAHDFRRDAIELQLVDGWVTAKGTTLGSDNGIGVAAALAVMEDSSLVHGPLEFLFTVDEETGLTGARHIKPGFLKGKKYLNLDSEEEGVYTIGCAGGADSVLKLPVSYVPAPIGEALKVHVSGLRGGHSGLDINTGRANALKVLTRLLWRADGVYEYAAADCGGGNKRNAIARESWTDVVVGRNSVEDFTTRVNRLAEAIKFEFRTVEPGLQVRVEKLPQAPARVLDSASWQRLLNALYVLPHGVLAMSREIAGLVETSNNVATLACNETHAVIQMSSRSSVMSALEAVRNRLKAFAELVGGEIEQPGGYPSWTPNLQSPLLAVMQEVHRRVFGKEAEVTAVHAGLECGIIGEKFPGMDMISLGPTIQHPHSPEERVNVASVESFWKLLTAALARLAEA